jgi:hypothetical protein
VNSEAEIYDFLLSGSTPSPAGPAALNQTVNTVLQLYPDLPALGSPFDTGDETFGLSSQYKRFAAVGAYHSKPSS